MLQPKKSKFRRTHRLRSQGKKKFTTRGSKISFGVIGLKATTGGEITSRQIEAARRALTRTVKRGGKVWIRVFPDRVVTAKGAEVPMGSGKGAPDYWVQQIHPGRVMFEMAGSDPELMRRALELAAYKLPFKCKVVTPEI